MRFACRSMLYLIALMSIVSCTVWESSPIEMREAVGAGKVKITTGLSVSLEQSVVTEDRLWVVFHSGATRRYDHISSFEDHYFGHRNSGLIDSLNQKKIRVIFPEKMLKSQVYRKIIQEDGDRFFGVGWGRQLDDRNGTYIDVDSVFEVQKKDKRRSTYLTIGTIVAVVALTPALAVVLVLLVFSYVNPYVILLALGAILGLTLYVLHRFSNPD